MRKLPFATIKQQSYLESRMRNRTESLAATGVSAPVALTSGFQLAFWTGAALVAIGVVIAATVIRTVPATETSDEDAPERVLVHA